MKASKLVLLALVGFIVPLISGSCNRQLIAFATIEDLSKPQKLEMNLEHEGWGVFESEIIENSCTDTLLFGYNVFPPFYKGKIYSGCIPYIHRKITDYNPQGRAHGKLVIKYSFVPTKYCID